MKERTMGKQTTGNQHMEEEIEAGMTQKGKGKY